ncbi:MarR family transcriptional regulator [Amycolatopsis acidicola]|uniref:MarR family transcriptional regulator n=1 Tax=Amycolatopsis acidicola TaxID=2596893 RepID=A0A5N0VFR7_9PSEU|nr:MarR family transcriptional regulator [Amycolatopsis acidicola]KAA9164448.1 MarR family transcriptional regulator [Amycolatopsis acidicola]
MSAIPKLIRFGRLLAKAPAELTLHETAQALRIPVTTIGDWLRAGTRTQALAPAQAKVLSQLSLGDSLTVSALAQAQDIATSSMTEVVARLVSAGLVTKTAAPEDRRVVRVSITRQGRQRLAQALEERTAMLEKRLADLSADEREKVAAALPALWKLAELSPDIWPRLPERYRD